MEYTCPWPVNMKKLDLVELDAFCVSTSDKSCSQCISCIIYMCFGYASQKQQV